MSHKRWKRTSWTCFPKNLPLRAIHFFIKAIAKVSLANPERLMGERPIAGANSIFQKKFFCVMVTGISGAGKSQTIKCLEDFGYFCVDNLPSPLLAQFADLMVTSGKSM